MSGYVPMYHDLPTDEEVAIYEARFCYSCESRGVRREIAHDDETLIFTEESVCRPCALYYWGYNLLFGAVPHDVRADNQTLSWREVRCLAAAVPLLRARQPVVLFVAVISPVAFEFVDGCTHQYDWRSKGCRCRYCNCCSQFWTAETNAIEIADEDGPRTVDCPECVAWKAAGCPNDPVVSEMEKVGAS